MLKDIIALVGVLMILVGLYFVYWPLSLIMGGLIITSYSILTVWISQKDNANESNTSDVSE